MLLLFSIPVDIHSVTVIFPFSNYILNDDGDILSIGSMTIRWSTDIL